MSQFSPKGGLAMRPEFVKQIEAIARADGLVVEWSSDYWVCTLRTTSGAFNQRIVGGYFPLNNASAAQLANDKSATYAILSEAGVPAVQHLLFRPQGRDAVTSARSILDAMPTPLVIKPNLESGGLDVHRALDERAVIDVLGVLQPRYRSLAVSPYLRLTDEFRFVVLDGDVVLSFEKVRGANEWRHNLGLGASGILVDSSRGSKWSDLAAVAASVMDLRFATIDVVTVGDWCGVLEVNSSVRLELFSQGSREGADAAYAVFREAVRKMV